MRLGSAPGICRRGANPAYGNVVSALRVRAPWHRGGGLALARRTRHFDTPREALQQYPTVLPQSGVSASAPVRAAAAPADDITTVRLPIDIRRFPWIRRLAADYAFDYARVAEFFAGNPAEPAAWRGAIARAQQHPRQREAIAQILRGAAAPTRRSA